MNAQPIKKGTEKVRPFRVEMDPRTVAEHSCEIRFLRKRVARLMNASAGHRKPSSPEIRPTLFSEGLSA